jgi:hypothetical protein
MVQAIKQASDRVVATIPKGRRNVLRITMRHDDQRPCFDIRQHEPNAKRELAPTIKGISNIDPATARQLIAALKKALAGCSL